MSPTQGQAIFLWGLFLSSHLLSLASRTVTVGSKNLKAFLYGWLPLSDASGICPCLCIPSVLLPLFPKALPWAGGSLPLSGAHSSERLLLMGIADVRVRYTRILNRVNGILSNNIRILSPKNGGCWSRKGHSVEKTPFFEVFRNMLSDRWLHGF